MMSEKFYNSHSFKRLYSEWNSKLKKSGFEDAEDSQDEPMLKMWHSQYFCLRVGKERQEASTAYYEAARALIHAYKFDNATHRRIWELHSDGWSKRQIEKAIENLELTYKREQIGNIINMIAKCIK